MQKLPSESVLKSAERDEKVQGLCLKIDQRQFGGITSEFHYEKGRVLKSCVYLTFKVMKYC